MARTLPDVQRIVRTSARELTGCDGATFVLRDNGKCYYADEDAISPAVEGQPIPDGDLHQRLGDAQPRRRRHSRHLQRSAHTSRGVPPDIRQEPRHGAHSEAGSDRRDRQLLGLPASAVGPGRCRYCKTLADATSVAMENVRVYSELEQRVSDRTAELEQANAEIQQLSVTDELTRLNNRRGFYLLAEPPWSWLGGVARAVCWHSSMSTD